MSVTIENQVLFTFSALIFRTFYSACWCTNIWIMGKICPKTPLPKYFYVCQRKYNFDDNQHIIHTTQNITHNYILTSQ
jgi:hypothetical protein